MRLILFEGSQARRANFRPLSLSHPIWALRCGMTSLGEKLIAKAGADETACFVDPYMAAAYSERAAMKVNDPASLAGDDLLFVNACVKADGLDASAIGPGEVGLDADGGVLYARLSAAEAATLKADSIDAVLMAAKQTPAAKECSLPTWDYIWDLVLANPQQITRDFAAAGLCGIEGAVEQPNALRGSEKDVFLAPGAKVHPMVVLDASEGPIYLDEDVEVHPFTRIEGPCYVGKKSILLGAKCREGTSIGPVCRVGGEIEESIIQGHSNKYHDGFLGHAYVGEWVNLGALTTNSDLKNDYSSVSVTIEGQRAVDTGSTKVGSIIGDHTKTSIATLLNTGAYVGGMCLIMGTGKPLPKMIPSFAWFLEGNVTKGFGKKKLYETAKIAMGRRGLEWTDAQEAMWDAVFEMTAASRAPAIAKGRKAMMRRMT